MSKEVGDTKSCYISSLSDDIIYRILPFLRTKEVLNILSTCRSLREHSNDSFLWRLLLQQYYPEAFDAILKDYDFKEGSCEFPNVSTSKSREHKGWVPEYYSDYNSERIKHSLSWRVMYQKASMISAPILVKWKKINRDVAFVEPPEREGHNMVRLGHNRIVLTGGYTPDDNIYILDFDTRDERTIVRDENAASNLQQWKIASPRTEGFRRENIFLFAYGSSLTAANNTQMIRFGGFLQGGYSHACNHILVLTLEDVNPTRPDLNQATPVSHNLSLDFTSVKAKWTKIITTGPVPAARAYHTATLLANRYLVVIGGMNNGSSMMSEAILDTDTWTWLISSNENPGTERNQTDPIIDFQSPRPSARHGHSVVLDNDRNRLVLFGGGSGGDLLRDGTDNTEVWELQMGENWETDFQKSLPWRWKLIQNNFRKKNLSKQENGEEDLDENNSSSTTDVETEKGTNPPKKKEEKMCIEISNDCFYADHREEILNLGRCHISCKLSRDSVLFFSGGGQVSTNNVILYNLVTDVWRRLEIIGDPPLARFTAAGTVVDGWLVAHGGFSCASGELRDVMILDLIPCFNRFFKALPPDKSTGNEYWFLYWCWGRFKIYIGQIGLATIAFIVINLAIFTCTFLYEVGVFLTAFGNDLVTRAMDIFPIDRVTDEL